MNRAALILTLLAPLSAGARGEARPRPAVEAALSWAAPTTETAPPMTLTASDGTGLRLVSLQADALVSDPLAFTELRLTFENPEDRVREGRFEITLPPGAAISRFAMKINGEWQEGEILEKQRARQVYEDFLHRRQDPALLETDAGNQFRARIFPIPAGGVKELLISYSQELTGADEPWQLPLQGLPELDRLDVQVSVDRWSSAPKVFTANHKSFQPDADLILELNAEQVDVGLRHGNLAVARVRPYLDLPEAKLSGLTVLVDTSASRMLGFEAQVERIEGVMDAIEAESGNIQLQVFAFDQDIEALYSGRISGFSEASEALLDRRALGASDLDLALEALSQERIHDRMLLVTDGIFTAGPTEADALHAALIGMDVDRLDVLVDGGIRDEGALKGLVTAGLSESGLVLEATDAPQTIARRLAEATKSGIEVQVPGAEWIWPTTLDGVQSGDDTLIYAWLPEGSPMTVSLKGASVEGPIRFADAPGPLLERAVMGANIERLTDLRSATEGTEEKRVIRDEIVELSISHRVLSDFTALLVLETEQDYARYGIARDALADILTISDHRIQVLTRDDWVSPDSRPTNPSQAGQTDIDRRDPRQRADNDSMDLAPSADPIPAAEGEPAFAASNENTYEMEDEEAPVEAPQMMFARRSDQSSEQMVAGVTGGSPSASDQAARVISGYGNPNVGGASTNAPAPPPKPEAADAWEGRFAEVMNLVKSGNTDAALAKIALWRTNDPGDVLALIALGELYEFLGQPEDAARAYGSIIDLFPSRADLRRMAGQRLETLGVADALVQDTYRVSVEQRPDHPSSHRLYAWSLARSGDHAAAFEALKVGLSQEYPNRFPGVIEILREDLSIIGAAWILQDPKVEKSVLADLAEHSTALPAGPTTRLVLHWETDANDVDFHIYDSRGGHAWYSSKDLPSGGRLYADVTTGYGPECFTMSNPKAFPYTVQAHYYRRGPMGYGMGTLQIIEHDGHGSLAFENRPFVIMKDDATVDMGTLDEPLMTRTAQRGK